MMRTPKKDPITDPLPPIRLVPPMTTAAMACSSQPTPTLGLAELILAVWMTAARPARNPQTAKTPTLMGRVSMPRGA